MLYSLQIEKHVLGGLIQNPSTISDIDRFVSVKDFVAEPHGVIYGCLRAAFLANEKIDKVLLAQKIKNLGVAFKDEINIFDYIEAISFAPITPVATIDACKELVKLRALRDIEGTCEEMKVIVNKATNQSLSSTIAEVDAVYGKQINSFEFENEPTLLFEDIHELVEERGNNPINEIGLETPYPEFNRLYGGLRNKNLYIIASRAKAGKALEENTEIPTPEGFTKIKDLKIGDEVFAIDGSITKIIAKASWKNRRIYKMTSSDGHEILADENHEWLVNKSRWDKNKWEIVETKNFKTIKGRMGSKLPLHMPLNLPEKDLLIPPYILGIWLGDGGSNRTRLTNIDDFIINEWIEYGKSLNLYCKKIGINYYLSSSQRHGNTFLDKLIKLKLRNNKHIPSVYLRSSIKQRQELLQGLIDTDGTVRKNGMIEFYNKNKSLATGVLEIAHSLGIKAMIKEVPSYIYDKQYKNGFLVSFCYKDGAKLPRKKMHCKNGTKRPNRYIKSEFYGYGNTTCIEVSHPSHLFLCGRAMIPTHNSTFLNEISSEISRTHKIPVLILDTEMSASEVKFRAAAAKTGAALWSLETGNWRKNTGSIEQVRNNLPGIGKNYQVYYMSIGNKKIEEVASICRRWYLKIVGRDNKCLICYDYIKMMEKLDKNQTEWQKMGDVVDLLKKLSEELNCPILTAVQSNRMGITTNRESSEVIDDENSIGISDRICWYASYVGILRRKTPDEVALDTPESGTHLLKSIVSRFEGRDATGHQDYMQRRYPDGKVRYVKNYINFNITNFRVEERGSLRDSIARQNAQFLVQDDPQEHDTEVQRNTL